MTDVGRVGEREPVTLTIYYQRRLRGTGHPVKIFAATLKPRLAKYSYLAFTTS
jgi:hypothetical protein